MTERQADAPSVQFRLLGPLEVVAHETPLALGGPKQRLVLAHLVIRANQLVAAELLIDEVWGDEPPEAARASLHSYISHIRKALGPGRLVGRPPGYILRASAEEIDALRFEALVRQARGRLTTNPGAAARELRQALGMWTGEPLADFGAELSLHAEVQRLSEMRLGAHEDLIEAELAIGRHADVLPELERLVARHPLRERLSGQLMVALYRTGRQAEALASYHRLRAALDADLGIEPSPAVEALQHRILTHDPSLELRGEPLRGYRVVEQIGAGPLGIVHRATEPQTGREVAIKVLGPAIANDGEYVRRFDAEARRIFRFEHPHVVPLYDWWREPDAAYVVTRLMRGGNLGNRLQDGRIGSAKALTWCEQIGSALTAAHRQGLVHGDVRPANLLLDEDDNGYLADFAIGFDAALIARPELGGSAGLASRYLAPERVTGSPPSPATDIFAFGVVMGELLRGLAPGDDAALSAVLAQATSPVAEARPATAADLVAAARAAILSPTLSAADAAAFAGPRRNPYKGLRPFEEADALDFVGREDLVRQLIGRLAEPSTAARLLVVVGPSGSGKSSVVSAGLIPALRDGALAGSDRWLVATMTPGQRPFEQMERALLSVAVQAPASLGELLDGPAGLGAAIESVLPDAAELVLVIDQFEELFTLTEEPSRHRFLAALAGAIGEASSRVRVVITLRADFYDRALRHEQFGRLCAARTQAIPPFSPEELERVVTEPAEKAGLHLEPGLAARIVAETVEQPGGLPLLQYALAELWERREGTRLSLAAYEATGGIVGAVGRRAEQLVGQLDAEGEDAARQLFLRLVEPGEGTPDTSRRIRSGELRALASSTSVMDAVTERFTRFRLLLVDRDAETREPTIELAHESLLRAWPRLEAWVDEARDDLRNERRLAVSATQWIEAGRDPSFLLTGNRLEQVEQWASTSRILLAHASREYLDASRTERERGRAEERSRQAREAAVERQAVNRLRALVVVLGLGVVVAASLSLYALNEGQRAAREASVATARELAAAAVANLDLDPERSILLALAAVEETRSADGPVLREALEALHRATVASRVILTVADEGGYVDWADNADLGSIFVTQGVEESGVVNIRDADTGAVLRTWRAHDVDVNDVALSSDGSLLATSGDDGQLKVWDPATGEELGRWGDPSERAALGPSFDRDRGLVAGAWYDEGIVRVMNVETGETVMELTDLPGPYRTAFSPDGTRLAITSADEPAALVLDLASGEELFFLEGHDAGLLDVAWSPDGRWLATASNDSTAKVYDAGTGEPRFTVFGHGDTVYDLDWSPDSGRLATAGLDGVAKLWEIDDAGPREVASLSSHELRAGVAGVAFSPRGDRLITAEYSDVAVKVWDLGLGGDAEWANLPADPDGFPGLAFSRDGSRLYASSGSGSVTGWDVRSAEPEVVARHHDGLVFGLDVSPSGNLVASAGFEGVQVWDAITGQLRFSVVPEELTSGIWMQAVAWSPVGEVLATATVSGPLRIVDSKGSTVMTLDLGPGVGVYAVAFSPDGRYVAAAVKQAPGERWDPGLHQVTIWDWQAGTALTTISTSSLGLAFDPTGTLLATSSVDDGYAEIWDVSSGEKLTTLLGHAAGVLDVAWDPNPESHRILTASADATVRVWNAMTGVTELVLRGHASAVWQVTVSPDGSRIASAGRFDGTVRVWAAQTDDLVRIAESKLTRGLTDGECREFLHLACPAPEHAGSPSPR